MTPAEQQVIDRLTADLERDTYEYPIGCTLVSRADLRTLLSLLRPVASVEGVVDDVWGTNDENAAVYMEGIGALQLPSWPGATVGQRVRVAVHAVEGEEK